MQSLDIDSVILSLLGNQCKGEAGILYYVLAARYPALGPWVEQKTNSNFFHRETELMMRLVARLGGLARLGLAMVDLGPGSASAVKRRAVALATAINTDTYIAVDVSEEFLVSARDVVREVLPALRIELLRQDFFSEAFSLTSKRNCLLYLGGSTFSNLPIPSYHQFPFDAYLRYLRRLRRQAGDDGYLLIGWHSARTREEALGPYIGSEAAYYLETPLRVMLERGATGINLDQWLSSPMWHEESHCVSHGLKVTSDVAISFLGNIFRFQAGDRLVLNQSYKIPPATMADLTSAAGFTLEDREEHPNGYSLWLLKT